MHAIHLLIHKYIMKKINFPFSIIIMQMLWLHLCYSSDISGIPKLKVQLTNSIEDTTRIRILNTILKTYYNDNQLDSCQKYAVKSIYQKRGDKAELGYLYTRIGISQRYTGNFGDAIESHIQALEIGKKIKDTLTIKEALLALAFTFSRVEKWEKALDYAQ
jgi:tetratricopeptide (TPR) repeat protein